MKNKAGFGFCFILLTFLINSISARAESKTDTTYFELWDIDTLENTGGHPTTIIGNPQVVMTDMGKAVEFDGDGDMLLIDGNPLGEAKEFTIEIIFKPDGAYPQNTDPRFVHIQDPDDADAKRVMMELRITEENLWYLDGFMNTDNANLTLIDASFTHPTSQWMHAAVTYGNGVFKTYVNGTEELSDNVTYASEIVAPDAKTSLGARMNQRNWYRGIIKTFKVTQRVLTPEEFLTADTTTTLVCKQNEGALTIYPNPASQFITVTTKSPSSSCFIKIINVIGEIIYEEQWIPVHNFSYQINTSSFPEGIYLIECCTDTYSQMGRLMIHK